MHIKRDFYLNKLIEKQNNKKVKIITGIRRCGKSYLLIHIFYNYLISKGIEKDQINILSLDKYSNRNYRVPSMLNKFFEDNIKDPNKKYYFFIDEIQLCNNEYNEITNSYDTFIDVLLEYYQNDNIEIYITGSNSRMLSKDILTQFRDRGDEIRVHPLSFSEIYELFENKQMALKQYFVYGGMPYIYYLDEEKQKTNYLQTLFTETYLKDIIERNNIINNLEVLDILLNFISSTVGSLTNPTKLSNRFDSENKIKISSETVKKYLDYFKDAYIISSCQRFDVKGSKHFKTPLKYYFTDIGLRNARLNFRQIEHSHIMENIIYNELIKRDYTVDVGVVKYDYKTPTKRTEIELEIDFVVNKGHERYYIQSALNIDSYEKLKQEINSLKRVDDSFKKIVIVRENIVSRNDDNGILFISLEDFLLDENILN
ncbi:ATP-binding protein [Mycoplasma sp. HU2014]|uniref:ATP-binding protein n=1 Tax=Mycoplasma sp. HU2014 TaxID=1664275 RepID=UPI00067C6C7D|nr:ATP-binding protein [Mycoplasma sp. HU2014]KNG79182.1 AAA family ATPase [Mycoplasma sp. HU2014]MBY7703780.1 ATP-binding protein [Vibrio harveyi]